MFKKFLLSAGTFALAVASATTLHIADSTWVNGTELKPGDYKMDVEGNHAIIKHGKTSVDVPVTVQQSNEKYPETQLRLSTASGQTVLKEVRIGGTQTRVVIDSGTAGMGAGQ
jgi:hypothetical protein